ncbi:MAG: hypothetical protein AAF585_12195, partial [Verrucomicrobiota bacterium]
MLVGARVSLEASDRYELAPDIAEVESHLGAGAIDSAAADTGYESTYPIAKVEAVGGPRILCAQAAVPKAKPDPNKPPNFKTRAGRTTALRQKYRQRLKDPA